MLVMSSSVGIVCSLITARMEGGEVRNVICFLCLLKYKPNLCSCLEVTSNVFLMNFIHSAINRLGSCMFGLQLIGSSLI